LTPVAGTFDGGTQTFGYQNPNAGWQAKYRDALNSLSIPTYFVPAFDDSQSSLNYYRLGGLDFALRISQILSLGPDFVEIQSWNDAGESHYIGSIWPWALSGTNVGSYTNGYDHSGWQILLKPFIAAYKAGITDVSQLVPTNGAHVQGVFWHATLLSTASCSGDSLGKPDGSQNMQDTIEVAVIVAAGVSGVKVNVFSGNQQVGSYDAVQGLNAWEVHGLQVGQVKVVVTSPYGGTLVSGTGPINVIADSNNCNYNPQVVGLA
jgi:glucan endo-1,3-alpha-glucosidase